MSNVPSETSIQTLDASDPSALLSLVQALEKTPGFSWTPAAVQAELLCSEAWGLRSSGTLAAFVLWKKGLDANEIMALGTHPRFRRKGLMKELLQTIIAGCHKEVWLEVHEMNQAAIKLYQDLGFQKTALRKNYYSDGGSAVLMSFLRKDF